MKKILALVAFILMVTTSLFAQPVQRNAMTTNMVISAGGGISFVVTGVGTPFQTLTINNTGGGSATNVTPAAILGNTNADQFGLSLNQQINGGYSNQIPYHTTTVNESALAWFYNSVNPYWNTNNVSIIMTGDSTMDSSQGVFQNGIYEGLSQYMTFGGGMNNFGFYTGGVVANPGTNMTSTGIFSFYYPSAGAVISSAPDANWYAQYYTMANNSVLTNVMWTGTGYVPWTNRNTIQIVYLKGPSESTSVQVYTMPAWNGSPTLVATFSAYNATLIGAVTNISVTPGNYVVYVQNNNANSFHCLGLSALILNSHDFLVYDFSYGGQKELNWTNVLPSIFTNIIAALNPSLVLFKNHNNVPSELQAGYANFINFWSNAAPQADQIHMGRYQTGITVSSTTDADYNSSIRQACINSGRMYYDVYNSLPSSNQMQTMGWYESGGLPNGNIHLYPYTLREGGFLWSEIFNQLGGIPWNNGNYFPANANANNGVFKNLTVNGGSTILNGNFTSTTTNQAYDEPLTFGDFSQIYPTWTMDLQGTPFIEVDDNRSGGTNYGILKLNLYAANGISFNYAANTNYPISSTNNYIEGFAFPNGSFSWGTPNPSTTFPVNTGPNTIGAYAGFIGGANSVGSVSNLFSTNGNVSGTLTLNNATLTGTLSGPGTINFGNITGNAAGLTNFQSTNLIINAGGVTNITITNFLTTNLLVVSPGYTNVMLKANKSHYSALSNNLAIAIDPTTLFTNSDNYINVFLQVTNATQTCIVSISNFPNGTVFNSGLTNGWLCTNQTAGGWYWFAGHIPGTNIAEAVWVLSQNVVGTVSGGGGGSGTVTQLNADALGIVAWANSTTTPTPTYSKISASQFGVGEVDNVTIAAALGVLNANLLGTTLTNWVNAAFQPLSAALTTLAGNNGANLTGLNASQLTSGTVADARLTAAPAVSGANLTANTIPLASLAQQSTGTVLIGNTGSAVTASSSPAFSGANITANTIPNGSMNTTGSTSGYVLTSTGSGSAPTFQASSGSPQTPITALVNYAGFGASNMSTLTLTNLTATNNVTGSNIIIAAANVSTAVIPSIYLTNPTPAITGAQQNSPALVLAGNGWKTTATAASQPVQWSIYTAPAQGSVAPGDNLTFASSINGAASSSVLTVSTTGSIAAGGSIGAGTGGFTATASATTPYVWTGTGSEGLYFIDITDICIRRTDSTAVNLDVGGVVTATNGFASFNTLVLSPTANAWSTTTASLNSGYTNILNTNMVADVQGTSGTIIFWNRGTAGGVAINPLWTNTIIASGESFPVGANCGFQVVSGVGVYAQVYAP